MDMLIIAVLIFVLFQILFFVLWLKQKKGGMENFFENNQYLRMSLAISSFGAIFYEYDLKSGKIYLHGYFEDGREINNTDISFWKKKIHPDDYQKLFELFECLKNKENKRIDIDHRFILNNVYIWHKHIASALINKNGECEKIIGALIDVNESYNSKLELENKNKELDEFSYIASHDLQEPLRKLIGFSQMLKDDIEIENYEMAKEDANYVIKSSERMKNIIHDILELSRAGRFSINKENVDLKKSVQNVWSDLIISINEKNAVLKTDFKCDEVFFDPGMLEQILRNLISNSIKFNKNKKPIIKISSSSLDEFVLLSIEDNGIGIDKEKFDKIFQPFKRLHRRDAYDGSGIGLSICQKIVERHKGKIWLESELNKGTTFYILILRENYNG